MVLSVHGEFRVRMMTQVARAITCDLRASMIVTVAAL